MNYLHVQEGSFVVTAVMFIEGWVDFVGGLVIFMRWRYAEFTSLMFDGLSLFLGAFSVCNGTSDFQLHTSDTHSHG